MQTDQSLIKNHPGKWNGARTKAKELFQAGSPEGVKERAESLHARCQALASQPNKMTKQRLEEYVQARLDLAAIREGLSVLAKQAKMAPASNEKNAPTNTAPAPATPSRMDLVLADWLTFKRNRSRRLPRVRSFKGLWRFVKSKGAICQIIQAQGVYCIYSKDFVKSLARWVGSRQTLEIAAGDGHLSDALAKAGVNLKACDDRSWSHAVKVPDWVDDSKAENALNTYQPEVVICSWPPAGNSFEKSVFACKSVQAYVVIISKHDFAAGNHQTYAKSHKEFTCSLRDDWAALLLPEEFDHRVLVFERRSQNH